MRKSILLLLASGMFVSAFSQPDILKNIGDSSAKWKITTAKGIKKGMGRLSLNFPSGIYWSVDIYKRNKFITNRSIETYKLKHHDLSPGLYNLKLNTVLIENVEIKEGQATTLRAGVLDINSNDWELRSEDGKKYLTSGNKPNKLVLPAGRYKLIERKTPRLVDVELESVGEDQKVVETGEWVMTPTSTIGKTEKGVLRMNIPEASSWQGLRVYKQEDDGVHFTYACGANTQNIPCPQLNNSLADGKYDIVFYRAINSSLSAKGIPIQKNYETRLKLGSLRCSLLGSWALFDEARKEYYFFNRTDLITLPVGTYYVKNLGEYRKVVIRDEKTIVLEHISTSLSSDPKWTMAPIGKPVAKPGLGRFHTVFPEDVLGASIIYHLGSEAVVSYFSNDEKYLDIKPGKFNLEYKNIPIKNLEIVSGKETRLKIGFLDLKNNSGSNCFLMDETKLIKYGRYDSSGKISLPAGVYYLTQDGRADPDFYKIVIKDQEVTKANWPMD